MLSRRQMMFLLAALVFVGVAGTLPHKAQRAQQISDVQVTRVRSSQSPIWCPVQLNNWLAVTN